MEQKERKEVISTQVVTLGTLLGKANEIQEKCQDFTVQDLARNMRVTSGGNLFFYSGDQAQEMPVNEWAMHQLCTKFKIPYKYMDMCMELEPMLGVTNFNTWIHKNHGNLVLRTYNGAVRGVVSQRYTKFDAPEILQQVQGILPEDKWEIRGSYLNEERLHARLVLKDTINIHDDKLFPALFLDSSDVGRCALNVEFGIYRLVCTNGLVIPVAAVKCHHRHVGLTAATMQESIAGIVAEIPDLAEASERMIRTAMEKKRPLLTEMEADSVMKEFKRRNVTESEANGIIEIAKKQYEPTQWGLVNAVTEFAQTVTMERRLELERTAGYMLAAA